MHDPYRTHACTTVVVYSKHARYSWVGNKQAIRIDEPGLRESYWAANESPTMLSFKLSTPQQLERDLTKPRLHTRLQTRLCCNQRSAE